MSSPDTRRIYQPLTPSDDRRAGGLYDVIRSIDKAAQYLLLQIQAGHVTL